MGTILLKKKCAVIDVVTAVWLPAATAVHPSRGLGSQGTVLRD